MPLRVSLRVVVVALCGVLVSTPAATAAPHLDPPNAALPVAELPAAASALAAARLTATLVESVAEDSGPTATGDDLVWPLKNAINTPFGGDHDGIDIEGETGDPVAAAGSGRITFAGDDGDATGPRS